MSYTPSQKELYGYYSDCEDMGVFNENAEDDYYWIEACRRREIGQIKVGFEPLFESGEYAVPWFDPPFFVFPQLLFDKFVGLSFRSYDGDQSYNQRLLSGLYGYTAQKTRRNREEFRKNDPVILSEGPMDAEVLSLLHDWSFASLGSYPGRLFLQCLSVLSSKILYVPDNDPTGFSSLGRLINEAKDSGDFYVKAFELPDSLGDAGDVFKEDLVDSRLFLSLKSRISSALHRLKNVSI